MCSGLGEPPQSICCSSPTHTYAAQLHISEPEPEPRCRYLIHTCFTPKFPFSPSQKLPSLLLCFLHLSSCNISFPPASSTVRSGFAASYLPTVKAVPRLLKSLLPGGREDGGAIIGGSSLTAVTQQVRRDWISRSRSPHCFKRAFNFVCVAMASKYTLHSTQANPISSVAMETELM